jgi:two-component system LytT family response regulator
MDGIRTLIIDDERLARSELRRLLATHGEVQIVGEAANSAEAERLVRSLEPELLFLDIEMPGGSGFDLLAKLEWVPRVVFATAYDRHAVRAFEVNALDYLLKPVEPGRLAEALDRVRRARSTEVSAARESAFAPQLAPNPNAQTKSERVFVRDGERCWLVELSTVPLFESEGNYARLCLAGRQPMLARSLNHLEERLEPSGFFRANRKQLVNLAWVARVEVGPQGTLIFVLKDGREIELSRRQSQHFRERMSL